MIQDPEQNLSIPKRKRIRIWPVILVLFLLSFFLLFFFKASFTISKISDWQGMANSLPLAKNLPPLPEKDPNRINLLLLGFRGADDPGEGKYLSDAIVLASLDKNTRQVALISFPRDLYSQLWCDQDKKKINFAYAQGGLDCAKKTLSYLSGQYIDFAVSIDFQGLEKAVEALGGIDVYLNEPFEETFQWAKDGWQEDKYWQIKEIEGEEKWVFQVPQGLNHLDGQTALYYVRSRYSTDDFDRMKRQQQVLLAIKEKTLSLGFLANPIKIYQMMDVLGNHLKTDMELSEIKTLINLAGDLNQEEIIVRHFDNGPDGLLYHTFINQEYVLLPKGDDFSQIRQACQNIFN